MVNSDWDAYRAVLKQIYVRDNKPLKELRQYMATTYGFCKTKSQYERKFKLWGFRKYHMGAEKWRYVKQQLQRRNIETPCIEVYIDGVLCPPEVVQKEIQRQGFETVFEKICQASPEVPEGVIICSPRASPIHIQWPPNLPWILFSNAIPVQGGIISDTAPIRLINRLATMGDGQILQNVSKGLITALSSVFVGYQASLLRTIRSATHFASALSSIMPEQHEGQNMYISECLYNPHDCADATEYLRVAMFLISNNFLVGEFELPEPRLKAPESALRYTDAAQICKDQAIIAVFQLSGLDNLQCLRNLLLLPGMTAHAFCEKVFASAVRACDLQTMQTLLKAGMDPDAAILYNDWLDSPSTVAALVREPKIALEMSCLLLSHGAGSKDLTLLQPALFYAIDSKNEDLIKVLFQKGVPVNERMLQKAIETENSHLFQMLLDADWDINEMMHDNSRRTSFTVLGLAVQKNDVILMQTLLALGAEVDALQGITLGEKDEYFSGISTALGLAVEEGNDEMINCLLEAGANVNHRTITDRYITPLTLGVVSGHKRATRRLLAEGADVSVRYIGSSKTLIERALEQDDLEMSRMLMAHGARVDEDVLKRYYTTILYDVVKRNEIETVAYLLSWGARLDQVYDRVPDTVLGAAISEGHSEIVQTLLLAGARDTGQKLIKIGNLKTAKYLAQYEILADLLFRCGQPVLVSAIREEAYGTGDGLVQCLLELEVDKQHRTIGIQPFKFKGRPERDIASVMVTPLRAAICCGNLLLAKHLIERGAPITDLELTAAVSIYAHKRNYNSLLLLLAELSDHPCQAPNAFAEALEADDSIFLIHHLLEAGLNPHGEVVKSKAFPLAYLYKLRGTTTSRVTRKNSVLVKAATSCDASILRIFLEATTWTDTEKGRALAMCLACKRMQIAQQLMDRHADVNQEATVPFRPYPSLLWAIQRGDVPLVTRLIASGANLRWQPRDDQWHNALTPVQAAVCTENMSLVQVLLDAGADVNHPASCNGGRTALQAATELGNIKLVGMLLDAGADVNQEPARKAGATALQLAAIKGYIEIVRKLLDSGANVNADGACCMGRTALEGAAEHGRIEMLQFLLNEGALIKGPGRRQYIKAIKLADLRAQHAAAQLLENNGGWNKSDDRQYELEDVTY
ncbi:ankyrin [Aspergillus cavernicola]|uniref:Ankyrin n=1 Tax=Aspergillus cavernicola TaxID=176166 RepID=A0ABR4I4V3_9EURO